MEKTEGNNKCLPTKQSMTLDCIHLSKYPDDMFVGQMSFVGHSDGQV